MSSDRMARDLELAMYQPWTIRGPIPDPDGSGAFVITIEELPGFLAAGESAAEATSRFGSALELLLLTYLQTGRDLPAARGSTQWKPGVPTSSGSTSSVDRRIELHGGFTPA